SFNNNSI
ncbi:hypothetical protein ACTFIT_001908, partial [Dictyostelium discoideum]